MPSLNNNKKIELMLIIAFAIINLVLILLSVDGATFKEGADSSQYYLPAIGLIESGELRYPNGDLLTFGTPLYSIFLAIPIGIFGFESSGPVIILLQCIMLYITGIILRKLCVVFFQKESFLLQALLIFNPNSLITAHLVQSETLFTLILVSLIYFCFKIIYKTNRTNLILLGVLAGLLTLTRPAGLYVIYCLPLFGLISIIYNFNKFKKNKFRYYLKQVNLNILLPFSIAILVVSPWSLRNYIAFDDFFISSNAGPYLKAQVIQMLKLGRGYSHQNALYYADQSHLKYLENNIGDISCVSFDRDLKCNKEVFRAMIPVISDENNKNKLVALISSWGYLYLSGGASNYRNYLGLSNKKHILDFQSNQYSGLRSIIVFLQKIDISYFLLLLPTTGFAILFRILGIIGVYNLIKSRKLFEPGNIVLLMLIILFTGMYLFLGQSRFRVPLEPILMIYSMLGLSFFKKN